MTKDTGEVVCVEYWSRTGPSKPQHGPLMPTQGLPVLR